MVTSKNKISALLSELNKFLNELEEIKKLSEEQYFSDRKNIYSLRYLFQVTIETCINISNHIISSHRLGVPNEYADIFRILNKEEIITESSKKQLIQMARFRNRLVHVYWDIDDEMIFKYLREHLDDFYVFKKQILIYLREKQ